MPPFVDASSICRSLSEASEPALKIFSPTPSFRHRTKRLEQLVDEA